MTAKLGVRGCGDRARIYSGKQIAMFELSVTFMISALYYHQWTLNLWSETTLIFTRFQTFYPFKKRLWVINTISKHYIHLRTGCGLLIRFYPTWRCRINNDAMTWKHFELWCFFFVCVFFMLSWTSSRTNRVYQITVNVRGAHCEAYQGTMLGSRAHKTSHDSQHLWMRGYKINVRDNATAWYHPL